LPTFRLNAPIFRTDTANTAAITWWSCVIGYVVILAVLPLVAYGLQLLTTYLFSGSGITRSAIGPAAIYGHSFLYVVSLSPMVSWSGALVSIPFVYLARRYAVAGWGTAIATALIEAFVILPTAYDMPIDFVVTAAALPSALLGLTFWLTVRLIHPGAFARADASPQTQPNFTAD